MGMRDFAEARARLREWVSLLGTRLDRDRPATQTAWPGEDPIDSVAEVEIVDRKSDCYQFVFDDMAARHRIEEQVYKGSQRTVSTELSTTRTTHRGAIPVTDRTVEGAPPQASNQRNPSACCF